MICKRKLGKGIEVGSFVIGGSSISQSLLVAPEAIAGLQKAQRSSTWARLYGRLKPPTRLTLVQSICTTLFVPGCLLEERTFSLTCMIPGKPLLARAAV